LKIGERNIVFGQSRIKKFRLHGWRPFIFVSLGSEVSKNALFCPNFLREKSPAGQNVIFTLLKSRKEKFLNFAKFFVCFQRSIGSPLCVQISAQNVHGKKFYEQKSENYISAEKRAQNLSSPL